ncbi:hypothetical protein EYF80_049624 [Liparis tanakae]|uniref:Uncharacterized protein n=1 Tax=Liparis tanakae TaxID=230148 RepID=A0A4Z2FG76_9TELE|nr:hypothetical protein EYF80_049624 [Liparis tanakae]
MPQISGAAHIACVPLGMKNRESFMDSQESPWLDEEQPMRARAFMCSPIRCRFLCSLTSYESQDANAGTVSG